MHHQASPQLQDLQALCLQERQLLPQLQDHQLLQALVVLRQAQALHQELQLQLLILLLLEQVL